MMTREQAIREFGLYPVQLADGAEKVCLDHDREHGLITFIGTADMDSPCTARLIVRYEVPAEEWERFKGAIPFMRWSECVTGYEIKEV